FGIELLKGYDKIQAYYNIKNLDYSFFDNDVISKYNRILKDDIYTLNLDNISSNGYVVSTLESVLYIFLTSNDYNNTILRAINLGDDTDTIGSCTGGLLGFYYGIDSIKENWRKNILKYDY